MFATIGTQTIIILTLPHNNRPLSGLEEARDERTFLNLNKRNDNGIAHIVTISIIDNTCVKLIGVVPYDPELIRAGNEGVLVDEMLSFNVTHAFDNIAARTLGEGRRLFAHIHRLKKLK